MANAEDFTLLLDRASAGDATAQRAVWSEAYAELHRMARNLVAEGPRGPGPTTVLHEGFLKTFGASSPTTWDNRAHFFGSYARAMGQCLIDWHRSARRHKRGGGKAPLSLAEVPGAIPGFEPIRTFDEAMTDLHAHVAEALEELSKEAPLTADVVRVRFLAGLSLEHASVVLGIAPRTVSKHWNLGRAQLRLRIASRAGLAAEPDAGAVARPADEGA